LKKIKVLWGDMLKRKLFGLVALYILMGSLCQAAESKAWQQEWEKTLEIASKGE
jgi:hypothetical protein